MSIRVKTMGGGSGGGATASIIVTGLSSTDTVTATKDGKTVQGVWGSYPRPNPEYVGLPDGYTQVKYIESHGNEYIKFNFSGAYTSRLVYNPTGFNASYIVGGHNNVTPYGRNGFAITNATTINWGLCGYGNLTVPNLADAFHTFEYNTTLPSNLLIDGEVKLTNANYVNPNSSNGTTLTSTPIYLLANDYNVGHSEVKAIGQIAYAEITCGDVTFIGIPCKNSNGEFGLYDIETNTFFGNSGTGAFTGGEEVPQYIYVDAFLIPISAYGTWTVTATDGTRTKSEEVLVDFATDFVIPMDYTPNGTSAYFKFDNMTDSINDFTWSTLTGSPSISAESPYSSGHSLYLNGSSSVTIPYDSQMDLSVNGTIEFWAKITANATQGNNSLYGNPIRSGTFSKGFALYICSNTNVSNKKYGFAYGNGSSELQTKLGEPTDVVDGLWHHWSLNRANDNFTVYKDGTLYGSFSASMTNGTADFLIGKSRDTAYYWTGYITELLIVQGRTMRSGDFTPPTESYL